MMSTLSGHPPRKKVEGEREGVGGRGKEKEIGDGRKGDTP